MKRELETFRLEQLGRFLLRGLRIGASTVSIVERRRPPLSPETED